MKLIVPAVLVILLAGCAAAPAPLGTSIPAARLEAAIVPGQTTRAQMLTALGTTRFIRFDSGYETWLYQAPADGGRFEEFVVLVDPAGMVRKLRRRPPSVP